MIFPTGFPTLLTPDISLSAALAAAFGEAQANFPSANISRLAISIVALDEIPFQVTFKHAGLRDREVHYSASLLKVAAMFAAFQLRQSANEFAASASSPTPDALFADMSAAFDPVIRSAVPLTMDANNPAIQPVITAPKYRDIFVSIPLVDGGFAIAFSGPFINNLRDMMVISSNQAAAACIEQMGYKWINGTLAGGGFYNDASRQGIWLAGTFTGSLPYVRISSVNDGLVAQATTTFDMANLMALMQQKTAIDDNGRDKICNEMLTILDDTEAGPEPSFMKAGARPGITGLSDDFGITNTKIGLGPLKPENGGFDVVSEATVLMHLPTGKKFITVWQNIRNDAVSLNAVTFLVEQTIKHSLGIL